MNKKQTDLMFSSKSVIWGTPDSLFDKLDNEFNFDVDVCALENNAKCKNFFTPKIDGLKQDWGGKVCWMNPPYNKPEQKCKKTVRRKNV